VRTPRLLTELALSRGDGRYVRRLAALAKIGVLVLDDFILTPPSIVEAKDRLEVIDDRSQVRSTVVVSQLPVRTGTPRWRLVTRGWQMPSLIDWSTTPTGWP
jgi:DNA replication protein DnaC